MANQDYDWINLNHEDSFFQNTTKSVELEHQANFFFVYNKYFSKKILKIEYENPNFIHDVVYFTLFETTKSDFKLGRLTPDFINDDIVLEIGTTAISHAENLENLLEKKRQKYLQFVGQRKLCIIIVSYDVVLSNYELSDETVDALIMNYRNVKTLQKKFLDQGLSYWVSSSSSNFNKRFDSLLDNYKIANSSDGLKMSLNLIDLHWDSYDYNESLKSILQESCEFTIKGIKNPTYIERDEYNVQLPSEGKTNLKRITVIPMLCPKKRNDSKLIQIEFMHEIVQKSKHAIIKEGESTQKTQDDFFEDLSIQAIVSGYYEDKAKNKKEKKGYQFKPDLTPNELTELNLDGIMAKASKDKTEVKEKRLQSKIPFSSTVDTNDISDFIKEFPCLLNDTIVNVPNDSVVPLMKAAYNTMRDANINLVDQGKVLIDERNNLNKTKLFNWLNFISDLMFEINLSLRENTKGGFFIVKALHRYRADVYIKTTKSNSHIFFFIVCEKEYSLSKTIGPKFVEKDNICVTEWGSMLKRDLENFLNIKETVLSSYYCYDEIFEQNKIEPLNNAKCLSLLILLNNKDRNEEILTSLRYTYMKSLSLTENSCTMNKKLNLLFRDRLQVFLTKRVINLNNFLSKNKPKVTVVDGQLEVSGLKDLFFKDITFKEAINLSYSGYIMTKVKQPQNNQASKMIEKIAEYEEKIINVLPQEISIQGLNEEKTHCFDYKFVRTFAEISKNVLKQNFGETFEKMLDDRIYKNVQSIDFEAISTLKASAKQDLKGEFSEENLKSLSSARPRVLTNVVSLIKKHDPQHFIDLIQICINHIIDNDSFNVELFPKDQHNGLREIYVIDIHARIVQLFLETISRSICSFFPSETLNHPKNSTSLIPKALKDCLEKNQKPFCLMKSGDASKWSQSQIVSKFYIVLKSFLPNKYHKIIRDSLSLWFDKKIFLPPALISAFMSNDFSTTNCLLNNLREGKCPEFYKKGDMFMRIKSGFMQGILHHTSSLFHTIVQESFKQLQLKMLHDYFSDTNLKDSLGKLSITVLQGSDDSSMAIMGDARMFNKNKSLFLSLMHLKDKMSYKFGIIPSIEKTATCVPFIIEYNSQWLALGKSIQPTIKFSMVSCQLPSAQSIIQRQEFYYNLLKDCLEKGCSTSTCFKIKLCQLSSHYNMLGCNTTSSFPLASKHLLETLNPSLGFFILEPIVSTGVFGFDFSFFCHMQGTLVKMLPGDHMLPHESNLPSGNTARINVHISKTSWKKWKDLLSSVGDLTEDEIEYQEKNPLIYYEKTFDTFSSIIKIKQKIHDFDVKQSLSSRYGITENMASFFSTFIKVCKIGKEKDSLIGWMMKCVNMKDLNLASMFPKFSIYEDILHFICQLSEQSYLVNADYIQRGRSQITVLHSKTSENELLLDTVKNYWFELEIDDNLKSAYSKLFEEYKREFDWLKDTEKETREYLKCSSRQLSNFIRNVVGKNRVLTFYDTVAKGSNYPYLLTRIFEKGKKVQVVRRKEFEITNNDDIFSNLKVLLNLPYMENYKQDIVPKLVNQLDTSQLTTREKLKYDILLDLLNDKEEEFLNNLFKYSFSSHLSWFSQAQTFDKSEKKWTGSGCLTTMISNLVIKTHLYDDKIIKITTNDLEAFKENLSTYMKILREHRFSLDDNSNETLKLSKHGISTKFVGSELALDIHLKVNIKDLKYAKLAFTNGNMKIVAPITGIENSNIEHKTASLEELYLVSRIRKPKTLKEREKMNSKGLIEEEIWINSKFYMKQRDGNVLRTKYLLSGKDVKTSTLMNFEIWKKITMPTFKQLFDWGFLGTKIVNQETLIINDFVDVWLERLSPSTPVDEMFAEFCSKNYFNPNEFLEFISKVQFFKRAVEPEYDDLVVKDITEEQVEEAAAFINKLFANTSKFDAAIAKSIELDKCLEGLDDAMINSTIDLEYTRYIVYGIKESQTTFPNALLYTFEHDLQRQVPDEEELMTIKLEGDKNNLTTLTQQIAMKLMYDTPMLSKDANTVRKLRELWKLGYITQSIKSTRSSRSSTRFGLHSPDDKQEFILLKKFRLSPKQDDFKENLMTEIEETLSAIKEVSDIVDKTQNRRVKLPLITQLSELNEDLRLLRHFESKLMTQEMEVLIDEPETKLLSETSVSLFEELDNLPSDDETIASDEQALNYDEKDMLRAQYNECVIKKHDLMNYLPISPYQFVMKEFNIIDTLKSSSLNIYHNGEQVSENLNTSKAIWIEDSSDEVSLFSLEPFLQLELNKQLSSLSVKKVSSSPGGSCLFNALTSLLAASKLLKLDQMDLRQMIYNSDHELELDLDNHRQQILDVNTWGNENDISCLSHLLEFRVSVITKYGILTYGNSQVFIGFLINHDNIHFDILT